MLSDTDPLQLSSSRVRNSLSTSNLFFPVTDVPGVKPPSLQQVMFLKQPVRPANLHKLIEHAEGLVDRNRADLERIEQIRATYSNGRSIHAQYKVGPLLGRGAFGEVYEVFDQLTGGRMAMKQLRVQSEHMADELLNEILTMKKLQHDNIIHFFHAEKGDDFQIKMFMELAVGGTLKDKVVKGGLSLSNLVPYLSDVLKGLEYIHSHRYVHGDVKPSNVLLNGEGRCKLGDFGTAKQLHDSKDKIYVLRGSPLYMAPEVINADHELKIGYDTKADIWSVGVIALELVTGRSPFYHIEGAGGMVFMKYVCELTEAPDLSPLFELDPLIFEFVKSCLEPDPEKRPSASELLKSSVFVDVDGRLPAERMLKRARLLHILNKYVAFEDRGSVEEDDICDAYDNDNNPKKREHTATGGKDNGKEKRDGRVLGSVVRSVTEANLLRMTAKGFFSEDDTDDEKEDCVESTAPESSSKPVRVHTRTTVTTDGGRDHSNSRSSSGSSRAALGNFPVILGRSDGTFETIEVEPTRGTSLHIVGEEGGGLARVRSRRAPLMEGDIMPTQYMSSES